MARSFDPLTSPIDATTPGVVLLSDPNPTTRWNVTLNNATDYILQCPTPRTASITITGGRHVSVFGLSITNQATGIGEMVQFNGGASGGIRHIERFLGAANGYASDCFKTKNFDNGVVQLKYCRVEGLNGTTATVHADLLQSSGGIGELWVEDFTGYSNYAGFQMQREADVNNNNTAWTITGAVRTGNSVVFTAAGHQLIVGDYAGVANVLPSGYNGGHTVTARTTSTFTVLLGDLTPAAYTSGGIVQKMVFNYNVGDVRFNRVNCVGQTNTSGAPSEMLMAARFGARTAPAPDPTSLNQTAYIRQNEDQTRLTYEAWNGQFEATDFYGKPLTGTIGTFIEPDTNSNNYSIVRPVLDTAPTPDVLNWPLHPQVVTGSRMLAGDPPGGDFVTHAAALDWSSFGGTSGGGGGGTGVAPKLVQEAGSTSSAAATTLGATWPAATTQGNLLILGVALGNNGLTVTQSPPAGWTILNARVTGSTSTTPEVTIGLYYKKNAAIESGVQTVTFGSAVYASVFLAEYANIDVTAPLDQQASANGYGTTNATTGTTATTMQANDLAVALIACNSNFTMTAPQNGFTLQDAQASAVSGVARISASLLWKVAATVGTQSTGVTLSATNPFAGKIATFKPTLVSTVTSTRPGADHGGGYVQVGAVDSQNFGGYAAGGDTFGFHKSSDGATTWRKRMRGFTVTSSGSVGPDLVMRAAAYSKRPATSGMLFVGEGQHKASTNGNGFFGYLPADETLSLHKGSAVSGYGTAFLGTTGQPRPAGCLITSEYVGGATDTEYIYCLTPLGLQRTLNSASQTPGDNVTTLGLTGPTMWRWMLQTDASTIYCVTWIKDFAGTAVNSIVYRATASVPFATATSGQVTVTTCTGNPSGVYAMKLIGGNIYAACSDGAYVVTGSGNTWTKISGTFFTGQCQAIGGFANTIYAVNKTTSGAPTQTICRTTAGTSSTLSSWSYLVNSSNCINQILGDNTPWWLYGIASSPDKINSNPHTGSGTPFLASDIEVDPTDTTKITVWGSPGAWQSRDTGATWRPSMYGLNGGESKQIRLDGTGLGHVTTLNVDYVGITTTDKYVTAVDNQLPGTFTGTEALTRTVGGSVYTVNPTTPADITKDAVSIADTYFQNACVAPEDVQVDSDGTVYVSQSGGGLLVLGPRGVATTALTSAGSLVMTGVRAAITVTPGIIITPPPPGAGTGRVFTPRS